MQPFVADPDHRAGQLLHYKRIDVTVQSATRAARHRRRAWRASLGILPEPRTGDHPVGRGPGAMSPYALESLLRARLDGGFTLIEMIVVVLLLAIAMLGILAVFDASARINKSEQDVADAQGAVRYGVYQMTRAIRMAGSGGLFVTQAVLNRPDPHLPGITVGLGATATTTSTGAIRQRPHGHTPSRAPRNGHDRGPGRL